MVWWPGSMISEVSGPRSAHWLLLRCFAGGLGLVCRSLVALSLIWCFDLVFGDITEPPTEQASCSCRSGT